MWKVLKNNEIIYIPTTKMLEIFFKNPPDWFMGYAVPGDWHGTADYKEVLNGKMIQIYVKGKGDKKVDPVGLYPDALEESIFPYVLYELDEKLCDKIIQEALFGMVKFKRKD